MLACAVDGFDDTNTSCNTFTTRGTTWRYWGNLYGSAVKLSANLFTSGICIPCSGYRHSFHAGSHAGDRQTYRSGLIISESLKRRKTVFSIWTRTRARDVISWAAEHAERTGEYLEGIARIWQRDDLPAELEPYISVVKHFQPQRAVTLPGETVNRPPVAA